MPMLPEPTGTQGHSLITMVVQLSRLISSVVMSGGHRQTKLPLEREEKGCKEQAGLRALFIDIRVTKVLANFRKTFIFCRNSVMLSWRGKDGTEPSRDAAGRSGWY